MLRITGFFISGALAAMLAGCSPADNGPEGEQAAGTPAGTESAAGTAEGAPAVEVAEQGDAERPMDEVPVQKTLASGEREYRFKSGCVIVLEEKRAVVSSESGECELHHRDIALLYASGD